MSKILIHTIAFSPDGVSTAYLYNDIALKLKERGFDVVVLTTTPNYNILEDKLEKQPLTKKYWGLYSVSKFNDIEVKHVAQKKFKNPLLRIIGFIYWHIVSLFLGLIEKDVDVILSPSPPLTIGVLNIILGKLKKAKVIYNVQEIYPDLLVEGGLKSKPIIAFLNWMERFVYNHSHAVTTIDKIFHDTIVDRFKDKSKLHIIPNFVDTDIYYPVGESIIELDERLFPPTEFLKVMYAGNIGYAQDWQTLIELAEILKNNPIRFFVIGEGVMKKYLEQEKERRNLKNVEIIPYQHRELMPALLAYSDLQFIFMTEKTEGQGFPSKIYTIMACAKPVLVCSGENTPIVNFLRDKECALLVTEKGDEKQEKLTRLLTKMDQKKLKEMGEKGMFHIDRNYSKSVVTEQYYRLILSLI